MRQRIDDVITIVNSKDDTKLTPMQKATSRIITLLCIYAIIVLSSAELFSIIEGAPLWQSFYWANMTSTSVGYGDISPKVIVGQILAIGLASFSMLFLSPLITARMASQMIVDSDKYTHEEQEQEKADRVVMMDNQEKMLKMLESITARLDAMEAKL